MPHTAWMQHRPVYWFHHKSYRYVGRR